MARFRLGVYLGDDGPKLGPGKIELLRAIRREGSLSGGARAMGMAYRHAWVMVDELNRCFAEPLVLAKVGGRDGGGAVLTSLGEEIVDRFEEMERVVGRSLDEHLAALEARLARSRRRSRRRPAR